MTEWVFSSLLSHLKNNNKKFSFNKTKCIALNQVLNQLFACFLRQLKSKLSEASELQIFLTESFGEPEYYTIELRNFGKK